MTAGSGAGTHAVVVHVAIPRKPFQGTSRSHHRVAVVAGRRVGNAVKRNRAKRRLRAIYPDTLSVQDVREPLDIVLVAKPGIASVGYKELRNDVQSAFLRACKRLGS